ncbi:hypothetical protein L596_017664 [Steinernema carpocapsae]|uniref:Uncharacterized protein n=1 Tax=Steinernema carpocapsae TaxID=34508 RepID=A0A4U5N2L0_STECR|nr:hypothetical protein L596_017664 [Steinernema carpocapsae]
MKIHIASTEDNSCAAANVLDDDVSCTTAMGDTTVLGSEFDRLSVDTATQIETGEESGDFWERMSCATATEPEDRTQEEEWDNISCVTATQVEATDRDFWEGMSCATATSADCSTAMENTVVSEEVSTLPVDEESWSATLSSGSPMEENTEYTTEETLGTAVSSGRDPLVYAVPACPEETIKVVWRNADHYVAMATENETQDLNENFLVERQAHEDSHFQRSPVNGCCSTVDTLLHEHRQRERPVSYYHLPELNKGAVDFAPRLVNVASQYHLHEMEDFHAFDCVTSTAAQPNYTLLDRAESFYCSNNLIE